MLAVIISIWQVLRQVMASAVYSVAVDQMKQGINGWTHRIMRITGTKKKSRREMRRGFSTLNNPTEHSLTQL